MNIIVSLPQLTTVSQSSQDFKIPSNYECASILYDHPRAGQQVAHQKMPLGQEFWPFAWTDDKQLQPTTSEGCYIERVSFSWKPWQDDFLRTMVDSPRKLLGVVVAWSRYYRLHSPLWLSTIIYICRTRFLWKLCARETSRDKILYD